MMTPGDFRKAWQRGQGPPGLEDLEKLVRYPRDAVERTTLPQEIKTFLVEAGLPDSASPFLDFSVHGGQHMATVAQELRLSPAFERYLMIGSNGSGDPIALDIETNGEVVCLNHDDDFSRYVLNRTVAQLASALLRFREFIESTQAKYGEDGYLDAKFSVEEVAVLENDLQKIDAVYQDERSYWKGEIAGLRSMWDDVELF